MIRLKAVAQTKPSLRALGFAGRSRISGSSSLWRGIAHQFSNGCLSVSRHRAAGTFNQPIVSLACSRDRLDAGIDGRLRNAGKHRLRQGIKER